MILARLSRAIRQQNWFAVALEFVIVVSGVLLAFQITAWNEARAEREAGDAALVSLLDETAMSVAYLEDLVATYAGAIAVQERAVAALSAGAMPPDMSQDMFVEGIALVRRFTPPEPPRSVYDALIATGDIRLITDRSVVEALSRYYALLASRQEFAARVNSGITAEQPGYHHAIRSIYDPDARDRRRRDADFAILAGDPAFIEASVDMLRANIAVQIGREAMLEEAGHLLDALCDAAGRDHTACSGRTNP